MGNLSKYIEDLSFINWVFEPTDELDLYWKQFAKSHPEETKNIQMSRKIIRQFRTETRSLSEEEKIRLFSKVLKQIDEKQKFRNPLHLFVGMLKYAAIALIFFSIGALFFYRQDYSSPAFYSLNTEGQTPGNLGQLIRSNGENISFGKQRSTIKYERSGKLILNKDTLMPVVAQKGRELSMNQLIIPFGKTSEIILPDGTKVFLNSGSKLIYPEKFTGDLREVLLSGEAYFEVQHDPHQPFVVQANNLRIKDIGTRFNISAFPTDNKIEVALTEGEVKITKNKSGIFSRAIELVPGQLASYDRQADRMSVKKVNVNDYILWAQGLMKFKTEDLSGILGKLERYYNIHFFYSDQALELVKISGKLDMNDKLAGVIESVAHAASVKIVEKEDGLYEVKK